MVLKEIIDRALAEECSDIHLTVGTNMAVRKFGTLEILSEGVSPAECEQMIYSVLDPKQVEYVKSGNDLDVGYMYADGIRIRANIYHQRNNLAASIRLLQHNIPTFDELGLPPVVKNLAELPRGLVLVTGPTGCGKSTTLASIVDYINRNFPKHIMTIEDPIEYVYTEAKSIIHQREVGNDVKDFAAALRSALREDPDIILLGEMRDYETISSAVTAAETGHLVFGTLHTVSAADSISRIIDVFPPHSQNQIRTQLSSVLKGVISQQLIPLKEGNGRVAATEILVGNDAVGNLIRQDKAHQLDSTMQAGAAVGMHTLNSDLERLVREGTISKESAIKCSSNPQNLRL